MGLRAFAAHNRIQSQRERLDGQNERKKEYYRKLRDCESVNSVYGSGGSDGLRPESRLSGLCSFQVHPQIYVKTCHDRVYS